MTRFLIAAASAASLFASPALAQAGAPVGAPTATQPVIAQPVIAQPTGPQRGGWQADVTRQQAQAMADGLFDRLDANHDGTVTRAEADQAAAQMGGGEGGNDRAARMIARLFGDSQSVTRAQFDATALARFDRQDLNHDGIVTAAERAQARANRGQ